MVLEIAYILQFLWNSVLKPHITHPILPTSGCVFFFFCFCSVLFCFLLLPIIAIEASVITVSKTKIRSAPHSKNRNDLTVSGR